MFKLDDMILMKHLKNFSFLSPSSEWIRRTTRTLKLINLDSFCALQSLS